MPLSTRDLPRLDSQASSARPIETPPWAELCHLREGDRSQHARLGAKDRK
jgi:hypothetical protein